MVDVLGLRRPRRAGGEVRARPRAQVHRLADVQRAAVGVAEDVDARLVRERGEVRALAPRALGIITNGDLAFQTAKIVGTGLDALIPLGNLIASGEVGVAKPHPGIFELAARHFGVEPRAACYVGDRLHTDAIGATRAGLLGVWIDRRRAATDEQLAEAAREGVPVIHGLAELTALLD